MSRMQSCLFARAISVCVYIDVICCDCSFELFDVLTPPCPPLHTIPDHLDVLDSQVLMSKSQ